MLFKHFNEIYRSIMYEFFNFREKESNSWTGCRGIKPLTGRAVTFQNFGRTHGGKMLSPSWGVVAVSCWEKNAQKT